MLEPSCAQNRYDTGPSIGQKCYFVAVQPEEVNQAEDIDAELAKHPELAAAVEYRVVQKSSCLSQ